MNNITTTGGNIQTAEPRKAVQMEQVELMLASLQDLQTTPIATAEAREATITTTQSLSKPAPRAWVQGEVAKTLVHYFAGVIPPNFAKSIGADYDAELADFPAWAIVKARRWWLSRENEYRHRKPLPGDLSERAKHEMRLVRYAEYLVGAYDRNGPPKPPEPPRKPLTPEELEQRRIRAAEIMASAGKSVEVEKPQSEAQTQANTKAAKDQVDAPK